MNNIIEELMFAVSGLSVLVEYDDIKSTERTLEIDKHTKAIKNGLNKFFPDKKCEAVIYTTNNDNDFFGIIVKPCMWKEDLLLSDDMENVSFNRYMVEFDSKLFDPVNPAESGYSIVSCLLYDIDKTINTTTFVELKAAIDAICCGLNIIPSYIKDNSIASTFKYCVEETFHQMTSIYCKSKGELIIPSEVVRNYELTHYFENECSRIYQLRSDLEADTTVKTLMLNWFFNWSKNATNLDTLPIYTLRKCIDCTGSSLFKNVIYAALKDLNSPNTNTYVEESSKRKGLLSSIKYNGMKSLEDDVYEYAMRVKNIDDESSAILLMRQINSRMSIISDYLYEEELGEHDRKRWEKLYEKYDKVREEMVKKPIYSRKMYGLFVDYNALMNMNNQNQMTMNTMY